MSYLILIFATVSIFAGIIEPEGVWDKKQIKTCFYDHESQLSETVLDSKKMMQSKYRAAPGSLSQNHQERVQSIITKEFSEELTEIHFTGWKKCSETDDYDLIVIAGEKYEMNLKIPKEITNILPKAYTPIIVKGIGNILGAEANYDASSNTLKAVLSPSYLGMASIGFGTEIKVEKKCESECGEDIQNEIKVTKTHAKKSFVILTDEREFTAVHEFGHVASLRHEHAHPQAPSSFKCFYYAGHKDLENLSNNKPRKSFLKEEVGSTAEILTKFDSNSVMSYCHGFTYIEKENNLPYIVMRPLREMNPQHRYLSIIDRFTLRSIYEDKPLN